MKKEIFGGLFIKKKLGKINYITQNKNGNICFAKCTFSIKNPSEELEYNNLYFAVTHTLIVDRLERDSKIKTYDIKLPFLIMNIKGLKKYLNGEKSLCQKCNERETCKIRQKLDQRTKESVNPHLIFFIKHS